jgi:hypothetical protein
MASMDAFYLLLMYYLQLIQKSKEHLKKYAVATQAPPSRFVFTAGAAWICKRMNELDPENPRIFNPHVCYEWYGILKYGVALLAFGISVYGFMGIHWALLPLSVLAFYGFEILFLFLFPLLIDQKPNPLRSSFKMTYAVGYLRALSVVVPIGLYMTIGLLRFKSPLYYWHVGCLAIVIWYDEEVRNRL